MYVQDDGWWIKTQQNTVAIVSDTYGEVSLIVNSSSISIELFCFVSLTNVQCVQLIVFFLQRLSDRITCSVVLQLCMSNSSMVSPIISVFAVTDERHDISNSFRITSFLILSILSLNAETYRSGACILLKCCRVGTQLSRHTIAACNRFLFLRNACSSAHAELNLIIKHLIDFIKYIIVTITCDSHYHWMVCVCMCVYHWCVCVFLKSVKY